MGVSANPYARGRRERQLRSPGVGQPDDRGRVEAHPDREAVREVLNIASAVIIDGPYLVATPAVKRPCVMKYCRNSSGSTPFPPPLPDSVGWALFMRAKSCHTGAAARRLACGRGSRGRAQCAAGPRPGAQIGVPWRPELAMGPVVDGATPIIVRNEDVIRHLAIDEAEFKQVCDEELAEIQSDGGAISAIARPSTSRTASRSSSTTDSPRARPSERPCAPHACARRRRSFLRFPSRRPRPWPKSAKRRTT